MERKKVSVKANKEKKKYNIKTYIKDFLIFLDKKILKVTGILIVVAILLIALCIQPIVSTILTNECEGTCRDGVTLFSEYSSRLQVLLVTSVAGIVPYLYAPIVGFVGYLVTEVTNLAYIIRGYGYLAGIALGILPLILNIIVVSVVTALGIYICRTVTVGYKISNIKNMNFTNFKIKLYETLKNEDKVKALTKKRDEKIENLEKRKEKIQYLQVLNTAIVVCVLQFISVVIQQILL